MIVLNDLLNYNNFKIYQDTDMFSFSLDSVLLANFVTINKKISNVLDIGCGNAPIPLILSLKTNAKIYGIEIQKEVAKLAKASVEYNNKQGQIKIINADINDYYKKIESDTYDAIVCNPPYFKINEKTKINDSKYKQIARHELFLNLDQLCMISKKLLKNNGNLAIVHRPDRLIQIIQTMQKYNLEPKKIQFIYPKVGENCNLILIEGAKNGKPSMKILPPIFVHEANGDYTEKIIKLFEN